MITRWGDIIVNNPTGGRVRLPKICIMQQEELSSSSPSSSYADRDALESPKAAAAENPPDLVASLVHVNREDKLPFLTTTTSLVPTEPVSVPTPTQHLQLLTSHRYVAPEDDGQHYLQVSQIATSPTSETWIAPSTFNLRDSLAALENARLTQPFSPIFPQHDSGSEDRSPTSTVGRSAVTATATASTPRSPISLDSSPIPGNSVGLDSVAPTSPRQKGKMFFGELQKSSAAAHRRRSMATTSALTDYEADLTSKDRMKQKDAIKRILAGKIREDWSWAWPRDDDEPGTPIINRSQENLAENEWEEREEWLSDASENGDESGATIGTPTVADASKNKDPFRFDSPEGVGDTLRRTVDDRKSRRRRRLQEEMRVNDGLSCFTHRRNTWTSARHVRRTARPSSNSAPLKRTLSRPTSRPSPAAPTPRRSNEGDDFLDMITEIRIGSPILPPETPMRKGINERAYSTIYDKVVLQSQTPFCPINLSVITKSCVEGWKRDGEWPPKSGEVEAIIASVKNAVPLRPEGGSGRAEDGKDGQLGSGSKSKSVLRRSLQKVMVAVRERAGSKGKEGEVVLKQ